MPDLLRDLLPALSPGLLTEIDLIARLALNACATTLLIFGLFDRRYRAKDLITAAAMFNIFVFAVLTVLSSVGFSVAAGFDLFFRKVKVSEVAK